MGSQNNFINTKFKPIFGINCRKVQTLDRIKYLLRWYKECQGCDENGYGSSCIIEKKEKKETWLTTLGDSWMFAIHPGSWWLHRDEFEVECRLDDLLLGLPAPFLCRATCWLPLTSSVTSGEWRNDTSTCPFCTSWTLSKLSVKSFRRFSFFLYSNSQPLNST